MPQKQLNIKLDIQLYEFVCKKSDRNNISNQELIRHLIRQDFQKPSEGDKDMLNHFALWCATKTSEKLSKDIEKNVALALKNPLNKFSNHVQSLLDSTESDNYETLHQLQEILNSNSELISTVERRNNAFYSYQKGQFKTLYIALGINALFQILIVVKGFIL